MADVHLPATLPPLFEGLPRQLEVEAASVGEVLAQLDVRWPGLRDRVCEPADAGTDGVTLRPHIRAFVDGERAELDTPLAASARLDLIAAISGG
ncbi:MAG TPA: MoaD/ThiS family protein [Conexibacter sp.]|jgi:molybdopterin converting factor small subunit|nr:MoaD/ThiS family protein [Conexibacter sp.]